NGGVRGQHAQVFGSNACGCLRLDTSSAYAGDGFLRSFDGMADTYTDRSNLAPAVFGSWFQRDGVQGFLAAHIQDDGIRADHRRGGVLSRNANERGNRRRGACRDELGRAGVASDYFGGRVARSLDPYVFLVRGRHAADTIHTRKRGEGATSAGEPGAQVFRESGGTERD